MTTFILLFMLFFGMGISVYFFLAYRIPTRDKDGTVHTTRMEFDAEGYHVRIQKKGFRKYNPWRSK